MRLLSDATYGEDVQAAVGHFPPREVVPLLAEQIRALAKRLNRPLGLSPWLVRYLEAHAGDEAQALLRLADDPSPA